MSWFFWWSSGGASAEPPAPPTGLAAVGLSPSTIRLTVVSADGAASFIVERRSPPGSGGYTQVATGVAMPYTDTGLTTATAYEYRVLATNAAGNSLPSNAATATTLVAPPSSFGPPPRRRRTLFSYLFAWRRQ